MKENGRSHVAIGLGLFFLLAISGCGKKVDVQSRVSDLEKAFPAAASTAAPPSTQPSTQAEPTDPNPYVREALSAVKGNDYAGGVIALQTAQKVRGVSADQLMTIERTKQAMTADLVSRADRGDAQAKAQLAAIEKTRSQ